MVRLVMWSCLGILGFVTRRIIKSWAGVGWFPQIDKGKSYDARQLGRVSWYDRYFIEMLDRFHCWELLTHVKIKLSLNSHLVKFNSMFSYSFRSGIFILVCNVFWIRFYWNNFWYNYEIVSQLYSLPSFLLSLYLLCNLYIYILQKHFTNDS